MDGCPLSCAILLTFAPIVAKRTPNPLQCAKKWQMQRSSLTVKTATAVDMRTVKGDEGGRIEGGTYRSVPQCRIFHSVRVDNDCDGMKGRIDR